MGTIATNADKARTILVVDDTPINLGLVMDSLTFNGYSVLVAHDGEEGIERAQFSLPDLIMLDVRMPGIDGFETCRRLKANPRTANVPVIFMTSLADSEDLLQGFAAGGVDYLTKPVRIAEMLARIDTHIALRDLHNKLLQQNTLLADEIRMRGQAEVALLHAHSQLELRVVQRTSELSDVNTRLHAEIAQRKLTEAKLYSSETRFRLIVEASPMPLCISSIGNNRIVFMNPPFRHLFNVERHDNRALRITDFCVDAIVLDRLFSQLRTEGGFSSEEMHLRGLSGTSVWVLATAQAATFDDAPAFFFGFNEVTYRKQAEEKLRASEASLVNSQRLAKLGDWEWHADRGMVHWSKEMYRILHLGQRHDKASYRMLLAAVIPEDRAVLRKAARAAVDGGKSLRVDCRLAGMNGAIHVVQLQAEATFATVGHALKLTGTLQDITELKRIQHELFESRERLRELSAYTESVREEERKRIAMEIHDELGQPLTALKMDVALLKMHLGVETDAARKADDMRELVEKTLWMVRNVASHLRPAALNFGIVSALEWLVEDINRRNDVRCHLVVTGIEPALPDAQATAIFRIAQASLTNVVRHASASRVDVSIVHVDSALTLGICDNGCGFDIAKARRGNSYGLLGMSERARLIGALLKIDSAPGQGTMVSIHVPLEMAK